MYLVTQDKRKKNVLAYDSKTSEYVYIHLGREVWREKGNESLLACFNYFRLTGECDDGEAMIEMPTFHILERFYQSCIDYATIGGRKLVA